MTPCVLCKKTIETGKPAVSFVGGMFPKEEPDFFMTDVQVMKEAYAHRECFFTLLQESTR